MTLRTFPLISKNNLGWALFWLLSVALVAGLMHGMNEAIRGFPLWAMAFLGAVAFISGWFMGGSRNIKTFLYILGVFTGLTFILLINSSAYRFLLRALLEEVKLFGLAFVNILRFENLVPLLTFRLRFWTNFFAFTANIFTWIKDLSTARSNFSPIITRTIWGILIYSSIYSTGWMMRRRIHTIIAALPIMVLLTGITTYTRQNTTGLILTLLTLLLLTVLVEHLRYAQKWQKHKVDYSEEVPYDIAFFGIPLILAIIFIAGFIPNIPYDAIRDYFDQIRISQNRSGREVEESLGLQVTPYIQSLNRRSGSLSSGYYFGPGPQLSDKLVMEVDIGEIFLPSDADFSTPTPKYYWFGRAYDVYTGNGWTTSELDYKAVNKNEVIVAPNQLYSRVVNQKIYKTRIASSTLYVTGAPYTVDQRISTAWRKATGEYYSGTLEDETYQVTSYVLNVSEDQLQGANEAAPDIIIENYLQIPQEMPPRVKELALAITQGSATPYEKAKAIETYLRQFDYTLDLPAPPEDKDFVDYFLFDLQKGYCDYFSSAMVMLARSSGLPARMVIGYSTGQYDYGKNVFVVTEKNAHAWPEIHISPYGWVPFEPTTNLGPFSWKAEPQSTQQDENVAVDEAPEDNAFLNEFAKLLILSISFASIILGYILYRKNKEKEQKRSTSQQIEKIYNRMKTVLGKLFVVSQPSKTPLEFQNELSTYFSEHKSSKVDTKIIRNVCEYIRKITRFYQQGIYTKRPLSSEQVKSAKKDLAFLVVHGLILNFFFMFKK